VPKHGLTVYVDSGILVKSYVYEENSDQAIALLEESSGGIIYTCLHSIEIPNAICLKRFRREITRAQMNASLKALNSDLKQGYLFRPDVEVSDLFDLARTYSLKYSAELGTRSLDILHVAHAMLLKCESFLSWDPRQSRLASAVGMRCIEG